MILKRAADGDKEHREAVESLGGVGQDRSVVVADVDRYVQAQPAVGGDGVVESRVEDRYVRSGVMGRLSWSKADSRLQSRRGHLARDVDTEVDPDAVELCLDRSDD
jgi:hypothetical protein